MYITRAKQMHLTYGARSDFVIIYFFFVWKRDCFMLFLCCFSLLNEPVSERDEKRFVIFQLENGTTTFMTFLTNPTTVC